jgi:hypothetical protein
MLSDPLPMIQKSIDAFRRELSEILKTHGGEWVAYHGDQRISFGKIQTGLTDIQQKIAEYLRLTPPDGRTHMLACFVGMLETGDATPDDFDAVQAGLAVEVANEQGRIYKA